MEQCTTIGDLRSTSEHQAQLKLVDFFMTYQQRHHISGYDSEEEDKTQTRTYTKGIRGDANLPTENHIIISAANGSKSLYTYTTWSTLLHMGKTKNTDIMVISEPAVQPQKRHSLGAHIKSPLGRRRRIPNEKGWEITTVVTCHT
jgi:hypothetical protein